MAMLAEHGHNFWLGCRDSVTLGPACQLLLQSAGLRTLIWKTFALNGFVVCGSLCFFRSMGAGLTAVLQRATDDPHVTPLFAACFTFVFKFAWMWPVRLLAFVFNCIWSLRAFDEASRVRPLGAASGPRTYDRLLRYITEMVFQLVLMLFFIMEANLCALVPYVGRPMSFALFCWMHAFYAFDYRWACEDKSLEARVNAFELHWDYFLGFGAPMTLLYFVLCLFFDDGPFIAFGVTSCLFPIHVVLTLGLTPRPTRHRRRLPVFSHFAMKGVQVLWALTNG